MVRCAAGGSQVRSGCGEGLKWAAGTEVEIAERGGEGLRDGWRERPKGLLAISRQGEAAGSADIPDRGSWRLSVESLG